jgi:hypothetical protein
VFVPVAGSAAQTAIETRLVALRSEFSGYGNTIAPLAPIGAAPLTAHDVATLLGDSLYGINAKPIAGSITRGIGDVELSAKFLLVDPYHGDITAQRATTGFKWRQSVGAVYRLATGKTDLSTDFTDIGTGDHQRDIGVRSWTDLLWSNQFWMTIAARYDRQLPDELTRRITDSAHPVAPSSREQTVTRDLGDIAELSITPRWSLNEWIGIAAQYLVRTKGADTYSGTFTMPVPNGAPVTLSSGYTLPFSSWPFVHRQLVFPVTLSPGTDTTVYLRVVSRSSLTVPVTLWSPGARHASDPSIAAWVNAIGRHPRRLADGRLRPGGQTHGSC